MPARGFWCTFIHNIQRKREDRIRWSRKDRIRWSNRFGLFFMFIDWRCICSILISVVFCYFYLYLITIEVICLVVQYRNVANSVVQWNSLLLLETKMMDIVIVQLWLPMLMITVNFTIILLNYITVINCCVVSSCPSFPYKCVIL